MPRWIKTLLIGLALVVGFGGLTATTACAPAPYYAAPVADPTPFDGTPGTPVAYNGMQYCGWMYTPAECSWSAWPAAPFAIPMATPLVSDPNYALLNMLFAYHLTYHAFYGGGFYYDRYLAPNHVTVVNRTTYVNNSTTFDRKYSSQEHKAEAKGKYKGKNGKTVPANKLPKNAFSGGNQKKTRGGNASTPTRGKGTTATNGKKASTPTRAKAPTRARPAPKPAPRPAAPRPAPRPRGRR